MAEKRRALGRGLGALIPSTPSGGAGRPVDVFFAEQKQPEPAAAELTHDSTPVGAEIVRVDERPRPRFDGWCRDAERYLGRHVVTGVGR